MVFRNRARCGLTVLTLEGLCFTHVHYAVPFVLPEYTARFHRTSTKHRQTSLKWVWGHFFTKQIAFFKKKSTEKTKEASLNCFDRAEFTLRDWPVTWSNKTCVFGMSEEVQAQENMHQLPISKLTGLPAKNIVNGNDAGYFALIPLDLRCICRQDTYIQTKRGVWGAGGLKVPVYRSVLATFLRVWLKKSRTHWITTRLLRLVKCCSHALLVHLHVSYEICQFGLDLCSGSGQKCDVFSNFFNFDTTS